MVISEPSPPVLPPFTSLSVEEKVQRGPGKRSNVVMNVLQLNAQSLYADGRIATLDKLCHERNITIACFQEARTKGPSLRNQPNYLGITGGADIEPRKGLFGMETWVANHIIDQENCQI